MLTANPNSVTNAYTTSITAYITANGAPVTGTTLSFASNNGGLFGTTAEQGNGYYNVTFTAPSFSTTTSCTITASGSKTGYLSAQATTQITVAPGAARPQLQHQFQLLPQHRPQHKHRQKL